MFVTSPTCPSSCHLCGAQGHHIDGNHGRSTRRKGGFCKPLLLFQCCLVDRNDEACLALFFFEQLRHVSVWGGRKANRVSTKFDKSQHAFFFGYAIARAVLASLRLEITSLFFEANNSPGARDEI